MKIPTAFTIAAVASAAVANGANIKPMIISGTIVPPGEKTYLAGLRWAPDGTTFCGGFLITPTHVLSAGHCYSYGAQYVSIGTHFLNGTSDGEQIAVKSQTRHPRYDEEGAAIPPGEDQTLAYDYNIIELASPSKFTPVALSSADAEDFAGAYSTVIGWGTTSEGGQQSYELLRADLPVVAMDQCLPMFNMTTRMATTLFCAGGEGKDSCNGDSGGPLVIEKETGDVVIGLVSGGLGCGRVGIPGVNTKISTVKDWILSLAPGAVFV